MVSFSARIGDASGVGCGLPRTADSFAFSIDRFVLLSSGEEAARETPTELATEMLLSDEKAEPGGDERREMLVPPAGGPNRSGSGSGIAAGGATPPRGSCAGGRTRGSMLRAAPVVRVPWERMGNFSHATG